jgi:hypothetical protein
MRRALHSLLSNTTLTRSQVPSCGDDETHEEQTQTENRIGVEGRSKNRETQKGGNSYVGVSPQKKHDPDDARPW